MPISLYEALVPSWVQILQGLRGVLDKAESWCAGKGVAESDVLNARIIEDMHPFAFQVASVVNQSMGAVKAVREGVYTPGPGAAQPASIADLKAMVDAAIQELMQVTGEELESFVGRDMRFSVPAHNIDITFIAENYLLSFAQPNFYFHATTAYDILRGKGLELGKRDFLGPLRIKAN